MSIEKFGKNFNPLVSIVIPVYNGSNYVREAIDSALAQTYKNIEIIVVNDGSTDNTEEIVKSYGTKLRYFKKENGGVSTALNLGIKKSKGEYISWLSHDDLYYPDKVERQVKKLKENKELDYLQTIVFSYFDTFNVEKNIKNNSINNLLNFSQEEPFYTFSMLDAFFSSKVNGCTLLIPKDIFNKFGYFDEKQKTIQDYFLFIKLFKFGIKYLYIDEVLVTSRHHKEQDTLKLLDKHIIELNYLYKWAFDLFKEEFQKMPLWQFEHFLKIIKDRTLDKVYGYMISEWTNRSINKDKPIIWMYWENKKGRLTPDYIRLCWKTIVSQNYPDFKIKILCEDDVELYLPEISKDYLCLEQIAHKADYIRFQLLFKYGGIWLDSDYVAFKSLELVNNRLRENGFVCCGYKNSQGNFFPLIGFLGSVKGNQVCKKVIKNMDKIIKKTLTTGVQPKWDELGGNTLSKFINGTSEKCFIYDSTFFLPYSVHIDENNDQFFKSNNNIWEILQKYNSFAFGQNIANSVISEEIKSASEEKILNGDNFLSSIFQMGLSTDYFLTKRKIVRKILSKYKIDRIFIRKLFNKLKYITKNVIKI